MSLRIIRPRRRPSLLMRMACIYLKLTGEKKTLSDEAATERSRRRWCDKGAATIPRRIAQAFEITSFQSGGLRCVQVSPRGQVPQRTVVYVPGGGYINPMIVHHWHLVAALARDLNARVVVPFYRLAPEGTAASVLPSMLGLHVHLLARDSEPPVWAGDSAGGGLVLATAMKIRDFGARQPAHLVLLAPWLDVTLSHPGIDALLPTDPSLNVSGLRYAGRLWAGEDSPLSSAVSPAFGNPAGLAPLTVVVGTRDIFRADCLDFAERAHEAGVDTAFVESVGGFHVYPAATFLPEARHARTVIRDRINGVWGVAS